MSNFPRVQLRHLSVVPITNGLGLPGSNDNPEWPRYIRTTDIASPTRLRDDVFASQPPEVAASAIVEIGDILMTAAGASIGKSVRYSEPYPACYAGFLARLRPNSADAGRFIGYWMQSVDYWDQIAVGAVKSTIENFSASRYRALTIPLPPLEEQRAIADYLDQETAQIDALVAKQEDFIGLLRERRAAVLVSQFDSAIKGRLRHALEFAQTGPFGTQLSATEYVTNGVPVVNPSHIKWGVIEPDFSISVTPEKAEELRRHRLEVGDIVLGRKGEVDKSALVTDKEAGLICGSDSMLLRPTASVWPSYLWWFFQSPEAHNQLERWSVGSTVAGLNQVTISKVTVPLPSLTEQRRIVAHINAQTLRIDALIAKTEEHIALAKERRSALITAAVTGQFDVRTAKKGARV